MNLFEAIVEVLTQAGEPLHYQEITARILQAGKWSAAGQTPAASVSAILTTDIKQHGETAQFIRTAPATYYLCSTLSTPDMDALAADAAVVLPEPVTDQLSFNDAAAIVLEQYSGGQPMHYKAITEKALALDLIKTKGQTPAATMNAQLTTEIAKTTSQGEVPRFAQHGHGMYGLSVWQPKGIVWEIEQHNASVRLQMHTALMAMDWAAFETLVGDLLLALGFEDVVVTVKSGDGGVDVRGVLVACGGMIRTRYAVQVKKWKPNVLAPDIQALRGSLAAEEHGLFVTTSNYSAGAYAEAVAPGKKPITLINGQQLLGVLIEYNFGVNSTTFRVLELAESASSIISVSTVPPFACWNWQNPLHRKC